MTLKAGGCYGDFAKDVHRHGPVANTHPTVKPLKLTEYLARLIMPEGGGKLIVPFAGSGSEMLGAKRAGWSVTGIELNSEYCDIAEARLNNAA